MDPPSYQRVRQLFLAAIDLPASERSAFLDRETGQEAELRNRLEALLSAHEAPPQWIDGPVFEHASPLLARFETASPGTRLGSYRVVEEIARGGMGAVYLARHEDPTLAQEVAIKLIKRGMDSEEILRRFMVERRILSGLAHPHIARLYDAGTSEDGRPFFVMELVRGAPLTGFAGQRRLNVPERLELFLPVVSAVSYAHQNLIVHRDLKPANVLVADDGVPKLLDFGIAKLLAPELVGSQETRADLVPRTPDYASPEQRTGGPITTATDIFGLGLLLYELLTAVNPLVHPEGRSTDGSVRPASRWNSKVHRDLDAILAKAMATEPAQRYGSARELAEDLERHLEHRPVKARRPTPLYRLGSAVRRHRLASAAAIAVTLAALVATVQAVEASRQRDRAQAQQRRAEALSGFLADLFDVADPRRSRGKTATALELLDEGARRLEGPALASDAQIQGDLLHTIGRVYRNLGREEEAREALSRSLALRCALTCGLEAAATEIELAHLERQAVRYPESEERYRRALAARQAAGDEAGMAEAENGLGLTLLAAGREEEGLRQLHQALARRREVLVHEGSSAARLAVAESLGNLAAVALERQDAEEADRLLREAEQIEGPLVAKDDPRRAVALANLAALFHRRGDFANASERLGEAVAIRRRVFSPHHPDLAVALSSQASLELERGRFDAALVAAREAVAILAPLGESPDLAHALQAQGHAHRGRRELEPARAALERSRQLYRQLLGPEHFYSANALHSLGLLAREEGNATEAEELLRQALVLRTRALGGDHVAVAGSLLALGELLAGHGRAAEAVPLLTRALEIRRLRLPALHPALLSAERALAEAKNS